MCEAFAVGAESEFGDASVGLPFFAIDDGNFLTLPFDAIGIATTGGTEREAFFDVVGFEAAIHGTGFAIEHDDIAKAFRFSDKANVLAIAAELQALDALRTGFRSLRTEADFFAVINNELVAIRHAAGDKADFTGGTVEEVHCQLRGAIFVVNTRLFCHRRSTRAFRNDRRCLRPRSRA